MSRAGPRTGLQLQGHGDMQGFNSPFLASLACVSRDFARVGLVLRLVSHSKDAETYRDSALPISPMSDLAQLESWLDDSTIFARVARFRTSRTSIRTGLELGVSSTFLPTILA